MGKYMSAEVEKLEIQGHCQFAAKFTWPLSATADAEARFKRYRDFVGDENDEDVHTGIDAKTLQGYYLKDTEAGDNAKPRAFVVLGFHNPKVKKGKHGLEDFCKNLIFGTAINATFYHSVEAGELKKVHKP